MVAEVFVEPMTILRLISRMRMKFRRKSAATVTKRKSATRNTYRKTCRKPKLRLKDLYQKYFYRVPNTTIFFFQDNLSRAFFISADGGTKSLETICKAVRLDALLFSTLINKPCFCRLCLKYLNQRLFDLVKVRNKSSTQVQPKKLL